MKISKNKNMRIFLMSQGSFYSDKDQLNPTKTFKETTSSIEDDVFNVSTNRLIHFKLSFFQYNTILVSYVLRSD